MDQTNINKPVEPKKEGGIFGHKDNSKELNDKINLFNGSLNDLTRRIRVSEERFSNLSRRNQLSDQNSLSQFKKVNSEFRTIDEEIMELKKTLDKVKNTMDLIIKEIKLLAKKEDVSVLQKYINLWEPMNFVTQNEVEKIVQRAIESKKSKSL